MDKDGGELQEEEGKVSSLIAPILHALIENRCRRRSQRGRCRKRKKGLQPREGRRHGLEHDPIKWIRSSVTRRGFDEE